MYASWRTEEHKGKDLFAGSILQIELKHLGVGVGG
jgi:hypothetical protein